ncbi:MAG: HAD family hydrolase [Candidatus Baldrarchaeota archaeon]|nr:HAD family hydrolase [Candidatus Baldrarchaeota archaeon]
MLKFVFFDLDGTLGYVSNRRMFTKCFIDNLVEVALEEIKLDRKIVAETFLKVMWDIRMNPPLTRTIIDEFCIQIARKLNVTSSVVRKIVDRYYNERFQLLKQFYAPMKGNREIIELLLNENLSIGIATDPVTKAIAVDFRLRWANIEDFPYCLITHGENMHAAKPHPEYFKEILRKCGARAHEVVMIGDDLLQDISGAKRIGIKTILVKTGVKRSINVKPDFEVESIRDVPEILMQLKE